MCPQPLSVSFAPSFEGAHIKIADRIFDSLIVLKFLNALRRCLRKEEDVSTKQNLVIILLNTTDIRSVFIKFPPLVTPRFFPSCLGTQLKPFLEIPGLVFKTLTRQQISWQSLGLGHENQDGDPQPYLNT